MISPSDVLIAARRVAAEAGTLTENESELHVTGILRAPEVGVWRSISADLPSLGIEKLVVLDQFSEEVSLTDAPALDYIDVRIRVRKHVDRQRAAFFTLEGFRRILHDELRMRELARVEIVGTFDPFRTLRCVYSPWTGTTVSAKSIDAIAHENIRPLCRALSPHLAPIDVGVWLLEHGVPVASAEFEQWGNVAAERLAVALSNEAWVEGETAMVVFRGPRSRTIPMGSAAGSLGVLVNVQECAGWVYRDERDIEVRHALCAHEIAREWPAQREFLAGVDAVGGEVLGAAKGAYRLHVQGTAEKTLKALTDLQRTLADEVNRVANQSRDLLGTLWRDLAASLTAIISRVLLILAEKPAANGFAMRALLVTTAVFVLASGAMTVFSNSRFASLSEANMRLWRSKLYGFLDDDEMKRFALGPLDQARAVYKRLVVPIALLYLLMAGVLFAFAATEIGSQRVEGRGEGSGKSQIQQRAAQSTGSATSNLVGTTQEPRASERPTGAVPQGR